MFTFHMVARGRSNHNSQGYYQNCMLLCLSSGIQNWMNLKSFHLLVSLFVYVAKSYKIKRLTEQNIAKENETLGQMK